MALPKGHRTARCAWTANVFDQIRRSSATPTNLVPNVVKEYELTLRISIRIVGCRRGSRYTVPMNKITRRAALTSQTRSEDGTTETSLSVAGHGAVFNEDTLIGTRQHGFVERIAPGAFADSLGDDVRYLSNHGGEPFARTANGTLRLSEDERGLAFEADLNLNMQSARDHFAAIERGDITQTSFAFTIDEDEVRMLPTDHPNFPGMVQRTIKKVRQLYDVSGVSYPAYENAEVGVRNDRQIREDIEDVLTRAQALETDLTEEQASEEQETPQDEMTVERAKALAAAERHLTNKEIRNG